MIEEAGQHEPQPGKATVNRIKIDLSLVQLLCLLKNGKQVSKNG